MLTEQARPILSEAEIASARREVREEHAKREALREVKKAEQAKITHENLSVAELRAKEREAEIRRAEQEEADRRGNIGFSQVYGAGWERIRELVVKNKSAALMYSFFAQHCDRSQGAVVCSQDFLEEALGISRTTIWRATKYLEEANALRRFKVGGNVYAYALNPDEIWKGWDRHKDMAAFRTMTLVRKRDQDTKMISRSMQVRLTEQDATEDE